MSTPAHCSPPTGRYPLLLVIEEARGTAFWGHPLNFSHVGYLYGVSLIAYFLGATLFQRLRGSFADVL